jgi:hypothetical protein
MKLTGGVAMKELHMELLEEARYYQRMMKEYPPYEPPREFIEKFIYDMTVLKEIYHHEYFGKKAYYIPDPALYTDEVPVLIDHNYDSEYEPPYFSIEIYSKETVERDLEAFFYRDLCRWIENTGDPLYVWLLEKIKKEATVRDYLKRVEGYSISVFVSNLTDDRFKEMLKWLMSFRMYENLIRWEYYERIKRREHLIHHKLNRKPILNPKESVIVERLGLLDERYFQFDWWNDEGRKEYLQEKFIDLVKPEYLRVGMHLLSYYYIYTDDLIKVAWKTFPEWFAES